MSFGLRIAAAFAVLAGVGVASTYQFGPVHAIQRGYRGTGMNINYRDSVLAKQIANNKAPDPEPAQDPAGQPSSAVYQNVKVLGAVDANEFLRVMASIANWVAPTQQCAYCHNVENLAWDSLYTKIVARRMMQMTENINKNWATHVGKTGVTCYTCHRGNPVPQYIWFNATAPAPSQVGGMAEANQGKNLPSAIAANAALPYDPLTPYLEQANDIRVITATQPLAGSSRKSIKQAEWTYSLMMMFANSLGVNCDYCHNTRAFYDWNQSPPQRVTAWYGIRMVRDLNNNYLDKLRPVFPAARLGAAGDSPKVYCMTCHQGIYKPLFAANMIKDYPELGANGQVSLTADIGYVGDYTAK